MRNWYKRKHRTAENRQKYQAGKLRLEMEGYIIEEKTDTKLSITQQIEKPKL